MTANSVSPTTARASPASAAAISARPPPPWANAPNPDHAGQRLGDDDVGRCGRDDQERREGQGAYVRIAEHPGLGRPGHPGQPRRQ